jgi:D-glycero-D-manno-heptose 1,7-bisphosphate phosphatase
MEKRKLLRRAVILDRDGTLNEEIDYLHRIEDVVWIPGAIDAVRRLNEAGMLVIVATNQAGVARGYYPEEDVGTVHQYMQLEMLAAGARVDAFYYSPYHPFGSVEKYRVDSSCRKPGTGMLERAAREWSFNPERSFMVGDKNSDIQAGSAMGMTTVLVRTGYGRQAEPDTEADYVEDDLAAAVDRILSLCSTTP